jgi:hypothetical protein
MLELSAKKPLPLVVRREQVDPEDTIVAYACATCGIVYHLEEQALSCHGPTFCVRCAVVLVDRYSRWCAECQQELAIEKEQKQFEAAEKLSMDKYDGPVFCDDFDYGGDWCDGYWSSLNALLEWVDDDQASYDDAFADAKAKGDIEKIKELGDRIELSDYVYAVAEIKLSLDADEIVQHALENLNASFENDAVSDEAITELQTFLDAWCEEQSIVSYEVDTKRVILLPAKESDHDKIKTDLGVGS